MSKIELNLLRKNLRDVNRILDLGCGRNSILQHFAFNYSLGVDTFKPCIEESKKKGIHSDYLIGDITRLNFKASSFDAVIAFDILEHLNKPEAEKLINNMEKWASKVVIIRTTNGFQHQDPYEDNVYQIHRSGFSIPEFKNLGYRIYGTGFPKGFWRISHVINPTPYELNHVGNYKAKILGFFKEIGHFVVRNIPYFATALLCIKKL